MLNLNHLNDEKSGLERIREEELRKKGEEEIRSIDRMNQMGALASRGPE